MRSKGQVSNLSVSWFTLVFGLLFSVLFVAASIVVINRYFLLYPAHRDLEIAHKEMTRELHRLSNLYAYQYAVADDYAKFLNSVGRGDDSAPEDQAQPPEAAEEFIPVAPLEQPEEVEPTAPLLTDADGFSLDSWGDLFPDPAVPPEQELDIERLQVDGPRFNFRLTNESAGLLAQGDLLVLFAVENGDRISLVPFPDFDFKSTTPDFDRGPNYNIRSSKPISGRLNLARGAKVLEMMVVARARSGNIVLKKKITPME
jgi:hypothetical protein